MNMNRPGYTTLDEAVAAEVRAEMARQKVTVSDLSDILNIRRATLSERVNGNQPFTAGLLSQVCKALRVSASSLTQDAEDRVAEELSGNSRNISAKAS